jgi:hypothetical protein
MHNASALGTLAELHNGVFCLRDVRLNPGSLLQYTIFPRFPFDLVNFSTNKCFSFIICIHSSITKQNNRLLTVSFKAIEISNHL